MKNFIRAAFVIIMFATSSVWADVPVTITRAELTCKAGPDNLPVADKLEVMFDKSLESLLYDVLDSCDNPDSMECRKKYLAMEEFVTKLKSAGNYHLLQLRTGARGILTGGAPSDVLHNTQIFDVDPSYPLSEVHILVARSTNSEKPVPAMIKVDQNSSCELPKNELEAPSKTEAEIKAEEDARKIKIEDLISKPANKDKPILKFDFSIQGAKHDKSVHNFNVKFRPFTTRRLGFAGYYDLTYFFFDTEVRINAKENNRKNVLNIGFFQIDHNRVFHDDGKTFGGFFKSHFTGLNTTITPKVETEWGFKEISYIVNLKETLPINLYHSRGNTIQLNPFLGIDAGFKHKSQIAKPGWQIARPFIGAGLTVNLLRKDDKPRIQFQTDYTRWFFLRPELSYGYNAAGKEIPDRITKRARDHITSRITYNAGLLSPFVEYEYGRVPPKFNLINSGFKTGIAFDLDIAWKNIF